MTTTLDLLDPMPQNTFQPSVPFNLNRQVIASLMVPVVEDIALLAPPTTLAADVGKTWVVAGLTGVATGAWATHELEIALCTAPDLWVFLEAPTNLRVYVLENLGVPEDGYYRFDGAAWNIDPADGGVTFPDLMMDVVEVAVAATDATVAGHLRKFVRFSNVAATFTFNSTVETFASGMEFFGRNVGAGTLTLIAAGGMTINLPPSGSLLIPIDAEFKLKFVAVDEADLILFGDGIADAPADGNIYGRQDAAWVQIEDATVVTEAGANLDATPANAGNYTRFTHAAATYTFDDAEAFVVGVEYHGRNAGVGTVTITEAGTMAINVPADGTLVIPPGGTFTVKIVAAGIADLFGVTVPA